MSFLNFVLSDIDGTIIPHPYFQQNAYELRKQNTLYLAKFCEFENFSVLTGRTLEGYLALYSEFNLKPVFPKLLGTEHGTDWYLNGKPFTPFFLNKIEPSIVSVFDEFQRIFNLYPDVNAAQMTAQQASQKAFSGFCVEMKKRTLQIDWKFKSNEIELLKTWEQEILAKLFAVVESPKYNSECYLHKFDGHCRFDVHHKNFKPKFEFKAVFEAFFQSVFPATFFSFGDEIYDSNMFRELHSWQLKNVNCYSVKNLLPYSRAVLANENETCQKIESILIQNS